MPKRHECLKSGNRSKADYLMLEKSTRPTHPHWRKTSMYWINFEKNRNTPQVFFCIHYKKVKKKKYTVENCSQQTAAGGTEPHWKQNTQPMKAQFLYCSSSTQMHESKGRTSSSTSRVLPLRMTTSVFRSVQRVLRGSLMFRCKPNLDSLIWSGRRGASTVAVMVELKPWLQHENTMNVSHEVLCTNP